MTLKSIQTKFNPNMQRRRSSIIGFDMNEEKELETFLDLAYDTTLKWKDYSTKDLKIKCLHNKGGTTLVRAESIVQKFLYFTLFFSKSNF